MQAAFDVPELNRKLFSPNGDDVADAIDIPVAADEPGTLDIRVHAATALTSGEWRIDGPVLRHLEAGRSLSNGVYVAQWDGVDDAGHNVSDGWYGIVVIFTDRCGNQDQRHVFVEVDQTPPEVAIDYPGPDDPLTTLIDIRGRALDVHFDHYRVLIGAGTEAGTSAVLQTADRPVETGVLATWNTFGLRGPYWIRLIPQDRAGNVSTVERRPQRRIQLCAICRRPQPSFRRIAMGYKSRRHSALTLPMRFC